MCRRNQLFGWMLLAFGLGLLIGKCLESGFISSCVGVGIIIAGLCVMRQK
jgi:membrane protein implicated in regulation of membrane protease activity